MSERVPSGRVIGQEWADRYPEKYGGQRPDTYRSPGPCIICGSPDSACAPHPTAVEDPMKDKAIIGVRAGRENPAMTGRRKDEPVPEGFVAGDGDAIIAAEHIYVSFYPRGTKTLSTVLMFHKGQVTTRDVVERRMEAHQDAISYETK